MIYTLSKTEYKPHVTLTAPTFKIPFWKGPSGIASAVADSVSDYHKQENRYKRNTSKNHTTHQKNIITNYYFKSDTG